MNMARMPGVLLCAFALSLLAPAVHAQVAVPMTVVGNTASGGISLGGITATITLRFDDVSGLSSGSLGVSARLVDPLDPSLLARLGNPADLSVPASFPLLVTIEPPMLGGLAFRNTVSVEIYTTLLSYSSNSSLRLFKAQLGGPFHDITTAIEPGSVRARGATPEFSEFLIVADLRDRNALADGKLAALESRVATQVADAAAMLALSTQLSLVRAGFEDHDYGRAVAELDTFASLAAGYAGSAVPNQWRALRDRQNVGGALVAEAQSLRFALAVLRDQ
jgi:hypothetical protein